MKIVKKTGKFLCSMKFAMILLLILAAVCTLGSVIPQKEVTSYYTSYYSEKAAAAILLFGLDDVFHCGWFIVLTLLLCLNLLLCNVLHFPKLIRRMKEGYSLQKCLNGWDGKSGTMVQEPETVMKNLGFRKMDTQTGEVKLQAEGADEVSKEKKECVYACRNRIGIWGAWLCHLGMLIIIAGFGLGQMLQEEYTVYGVPGQTKQIGELNYELTIDDFEIRLREDDTVEQYEADITVTDTATGEQQGGAASVNHPVSMFGMKFYQNSTGWAAKVTVLKGEEVVQEELLCAGEYLKTAGREDLILMFRAFYPDHVQDEMGNSRTASSALNNPAYVYALYYGEEMLGMNILEEKEKITVDEYTYIFHDPQSYTLLQVKRDPFTGLAALGGLLVILALILAFYIRTEEIWAVKQRDGNWLVAGRSRKGGAIFEERVAEECKAVSAKRGDTK